MQPDIVSGSDEGSKHSGSSIRSVRKPPVMMLQMLLPSPAELMAYDRWMQRR